ncbi:unnamed protein product [Symbiodinium sp. CCMP2592]|nr:unnamed protein product [Symbiodinium sp. CCMP2592]
MLDQNALEVAAWIEKRNAVEGGHTGHSHGKPMFWLTAVISSLINFLLNPVVFFATFVRKIGERAALRVDSGKRTTFKNSSGTWLVTITASIMHSCRPSKPRDGLNKEQRSFNPAQPILPLRRGHRGGDVGRCARRCYY